MEQVFYPPRRKTAHPMQAETTDKTMGALANTSSTAAHRRSTRLAVIGGLLGTAIGFVAGVAISNPMTTRYWDQHTGLEVSVSPTIGIPLLPMLMILVGVPLVAALIAAASIRKAPQVTRRGN